MLRRLAQIGAWTLLGAVVLVTLCPLKDRPVITRDPQQERGLAYLALGTAFAFGYPRRWPALLAALPAVAIALELAQTVEADRHGRVIDVVPKVAGAALGIGMGWLSARILARRTARA